MSSVVPARQNSHVVVGVDGSRAHQAIVDLAMGEAARRGAPLLIVHAWPGRYSGLLRPRRLEAERRLAEAPADGASSATPPNPNR